MMRRTTVLFLFLAAALSLALFSLKYQVQDLEDEFVALNRSISAERRAMHVLEAEWSYLNDPQRLGALAARHLGLRPVDSEQLGTLDCWSKSFDSMKLADLTAATHFGRAQRKHIFACFFHIECQVPWLGGIRSRS